MSVPLALPHCVVSMLGKAVLAVFVVAVGAADWSFKEFMTGEWNLERRSDGASGTGHTVNRVKPSSSALRLTTPLFAGQVDRAHYSLHAVGTSLEGTYYEESADGRTNEMMVRLLFDDAKSGQFQLAKQKRPQPTPADGDDDQPPEPQPMPEPKTAFEFDFSDYSEFRLSTTKWLGKAGGSVQLLAMEDAFVFTKVRRMSARLRAILPGHRRTHCIGCPTLVKSRRCAAASHASSPSATATATCPRVQFVDTNGIAPDPPPQISCGTNGIAPDKSGSESVEAWTAVREGAPRRSATQVEGKRSLLSRYGWYVLLAAIYCGYQAAKEKAASAVAGMAKNK